jgi:hypothetical protein
MIPPTPIAQSQIDVIRQRARQKATQDAINSGWSLESPDAKAFIADAMNGIDDRAWNAARQKSLQLMRDVTKHAGVSFIDNEADAASLGGAYQSDDDDVNAFADLQADQFLKGLKPIAWDSYQAQKRTAPVAVFENFLGNALTSFEGFAGGVAAGGFSMYDVYGPGGMRWTGRNDPARMVQSMAGMADAMAAGQRFGRAVDTMYLNEATGNAVDVDGYAQHLAGDPDAPVLASERLGAPTGFVSGAAHTFAGDLGAAAGSLPASLPSMLAPTPEARAVLALPFAMAGYSDAKQGRWDIYKQQLLTAEQMGIKPPAMPTFNEMEMYGVIGAAFEYGSEYVGDTAQAAFLGTALGRKVAGKASATSVGTMLSNLNKSMMRQRGPAGVIKKVAAVVGVPATVEGLEEGAPHLGEQVQDVLSQTLFAPNNDFYTIDRPLFSSDPKQLFIDENVWHSLRVGAYAGGLFGGGHHIISKGARDERAIRKGVAAEVRKGTEFVTRAIVETQETDAQGRMNRKSESSANKPDLLHLNRNAQPARGSSMAMFQVEQLANGDRTAMFVKEDDVGTTLTKDVRDRMNALGIGNIPITRSNGTHVYVANGTEAEARANIEDGNVEALTGFPELNNGTVLAGVLTLRNNAGHIVDVIPYSDNGEMLEAAPAIASLAVRNGLTVTATEGGVTAPVADQIQRQIDADAVQTNTTPQFSRPQSKRNEARGIKALHLEMTSAAQGSQAKRKGVRVKQDAPFESKLLSADEIGDATNADVTSVVSLVRVADADLSDGERNIARLTGQQATVLNARVVFTIKQNDGTSRTIERDGLADGAYLSQSSPDGVYLIRENGTAFTARNAFAIAMHETRHRTASRSAAGAQFVAKLLQIDPAFAMRGGAEYMRQVDDNVKNMSLPQVIAYYRGLAAAANDVMAGTATAEQAEQVDAAGGAQRAKQSVQAFAAESQATTANRTAGSATVMAAEYEALYRDAQGRADKRFTRWMANALVKNGFFGPEAQQVLFEIRQRLDGVREEQLQIHSKFSDRVAEAVRKDLETNQKRVNARAALQAAMRPPTPSAPRAAPVDVTAAPTATPTAAPTAVPTATPTATPAPVGKPPNPIAFSLRDAATPSMSGAIAGDDDKKMSDAAALLQQAQSAPPEQRAGLLASAMTALASVAPVLANTSAQLSPSSRVMQPNRIPSNIRKVPDAMRDTVATTPDAVPTESDTGVVQTAAPDLEAIAIRRRNAIQAMAIIRGESPTEPVAPNTVARIERTRMLRQTPSEEIAFSLRDRAGRREANDDVRSVRNDYMRDRGIKAEPIEDTYAEVDESFAKRYADWFESQPASTTNPETRAAYKAFSEETLDQYQYLKDRGYEIIPWAGEGQPYADSADMIDDVRKNKRVFYFKTINPNEAMSFGSNPSLLADAINNNVLLADAGVPVLDSAGDVYQQTFNDLFRGVHDILGHSAEGFQFGPRGEENAYRSHASMFSPLARQAMATETRGQNSWLNYGPNRRNADGSVWGQSDPRYAKWMDDLKQGVGYADQKMAATPTDLTALYSQRDTPVESRSSLRPLNNYDMTPKMRVWAKGSKVVDADGALIPLYHGTRAEFDTFISSINGQIGGGIYLTTDPRRANEFAEDPDSGKFVNQSAIVPAVANIRRPLILENSTEDVVDQVAKVLARELGPTARGLDLTDRSKWRKLLQDELGYDGIIRDYGQFGKDVVVFNPNQVKGYFNANPTADERIMYSQREQGGDTQPTKAVLQRRNTAAQARAASVLRRKNVKDDVQSVTDTRRISMSVEPTAQPILSKHIIRPDVSADPLFNEQAAYDSVNERVRDAVTGVEFNTQLQAMLGNQIGVNKPNIEEVLGYFEGRTERSMRIHVGGLNHVDTHRVAEVLGSLLLQKAAITVGPATKNVPETEQVLAAIFVANTTNPLDEPTLRGLLSDVGAKFNGATTLGSKRGVWAVYGDYDGQTSSRQTFVDNATQIAATRGMSVEFAQVQSTYTTIGDFDVLGKVQRNPRATGAGSRSRVGKTTWDLWVKPAATIVEIVQDEGFDIDLDGWLGEFAKAEAPQVKDLLIAELASRSVNRKHGLDRQFLTRYRGNMQQFEGGYKIPAKTSMANAERSLVEVDALLERHPDAFTSRDATERFFADLYGSRDIPVLPDFLISDLANNSAGMQRNMALRANGGRLSQGMVDDAVHGLDMAQRLRAFYATGQVKPHHTVALAMWGFMSRGVSPRVQESLFIDLVNFTNSKGETYQTFVDRAVAGVWTKADTGEWLRFVDAMFERTRYDVIGVDGEVLRDKDGDVKRANGTPGAGATHNGNAFGKSFLANIGKQVTIDGVTETGVIHLHNAMASPTATAKKVRRVFTRLGGSLGIDNKVISFSALVAGKTDGSVYDRVRVADHWNRDGRFVNVYDGNTVALQVVIDDEMVREVRLPDFNGDKLAHAAAKRELTSVLVAEATAEAKAETARRVAEDPAALPVTFSVETKKVGGLATLFNGARGIAIYEAVERAIDPNRVFGPLLKTQPEMTRHANHGAEHWLNWVGASDQEASHKTLDGLLQMIATGEQQMVGVWAKEGQYDTYAFGAEYGYTRDADGVLKPSHKYTIDGQSFMFDAAHFGLFTKALSTTKWAKMNWAPPLDAKGKPVRGEKPPDFMVTRDSERADGTRIAPWYEDPIVGPKGRAHIVTLAETHGTRMSLRDLGVIEDAVTLAPFSNNIDAKERDYRKEFSLVNVAAQTRRGVTTLYKKLVASPYSKPTTPAFTKYFDNGNALNGIHPNDIWFHGGYRHHTQFDVNMSADQFGLHLGPFAQATDFFDRRLRVYNSPFRNSPDGAVLFPVYARATRVAQVEDMGSWTAFNVLKGLKQVDIISTKTMDDALMEIYTGLGIPEAGAEVFLRYNQSGFESVMTNNDQHPNGNQSFSRDYVRNMLNNLGYDGITYENTIEGKGANAYAASANLNPDSETYHDDRDFMVAAAQQESAAELFELNDEFAQWEMSGMNAYEKTSNERIEAMQRIYGKRTAVILWDDTAVKSVANNNGDYSPKDADIRRSLRLQPAAVVNAYPDLFHNEVPIRMSMREGVRGVKDEATLQFVDKYDELRRYADNWQETSGVALPDPANPYLGVRVLTGRLGAMQQAATREYANTLRDMSEHNISLEAMDNFLTAQHAVNNGNAYIATINPRFPDGGTGMMTADAQQIINQARATGQYGEMNRIAEDWRELLRAGLDLRRDAGLITNETHTLLTTRYTHYVPLRGAPARPFDELFEDFDGGNVFGRGMSTQSRAMPERLGRGSRAEGVTSQVGFLHEDTMKRVARNEIGQRFVRLVTLVNDPSMAVVVRPTIQRNVDGVVRTVHDGNWMSEPRHFGAYVNAPITINGHNYEAGDMVVVRINNPRLATAMTVPNADIGTLARGLNHVNNVWRFFTTGMGAPEFAPVNLVRDIMAGSMVNTASHGARDTAEMLTRYPRAFLNVFTDAWNDPTRPTRSYANFVRAGGDQVYWGRNDLETKDTDFDALAARVTRRDPNDRTLTRTLLGWYPAFFTAAETATRLAQFEQRRATGSSAEQAALAARDITVDFGKGGKRKPTLNTFYMFLNASVQGSVNVGRATRRAASIAPSLAMFGMVTAMLRALGGDDEETGGKRWDAIPDYEKASNIILMDPRGTGKYIKIPLAYGFNVLYSAGVRAADTAFGNKSVGNMVSGMVTDAMNSFNPMGGSGITTGTGNLVAALFPTMIRPMAEIGLNQNFMGRPIFPKTFGVQTETDAFSYFEGTSQTYIDAAQGFNSLGGGDMFEGGGQGYMDYSPNTLQYLVGYYGSGFGRTMDRLAKIALSDQPVERTDIPLVRSFSGDASQDTRAVAETYQGISARVMPDLRRTEALLDPEVSYPVKEAIIERGINPLNISLARVVESTEKELRKLRKDGKGATPEQREALFAARARAMKRVIRVSNELTP